MVLVLCAAARAGPEPGVHPSRAVPRPAAAAVCGAGLRLHPAVLHLATQGTKIYNIRLPFAQYGVIGSLLIHVSIIVIMKELYICIQKQTHNR